MAKFARIFLKGPDNPLRWIDWPLADNVSFSNFVAGIRLQGCIMPAEVTVFIPFDEIKMILGIDPSQVGEKPLSVFGGLVGEGKPN